MMHTYKLKRRNITQEQHSSGPISSFNLVPCIVTNSDLSIILSPVLLQRWNWRAVKFVHRWKVGNKRDEVLGITRWSLMFSILVLHTTINDFTICDFCGFKSVLILSFQLHLMSHIELEDWLNWLRLGNSIVWYSNTLHSNLFWVIYTIGDCGFSLVKFRHNFLRKDYCEISCHQIEKMKYFLLCARVSRMC